MALDRAFVAQNRASTHRIRALVARLTDAEMQQRVGEHWTVAITLAHLAFWDGRVIYVLDSSERDGKLFVPEEIHIVVNDLSLPLWGAIPPRAAATLAIQTAEALDARLEGFPPELLEQVPAPATPHGPGYAHAQRWVIRALHRNSHLDEIDAALSR
jgi:hypothetical protein